jgi:lycopene cyclase domain-containing protein
MRHLLYLGLLIGCVALTVPLDFAFRAEVFRRPGRLALAVLPSFVVFTAWDVFAIHRHQWSYHLRWMTGLTLPGRVPLEEALFFVVVPVAAILTYEAVRRCRSGAWRPENTPARHEEEISR